MSLKLPPLQQMPNVNVGPPAFSVFQNSFVKYYVSYALSALAVSMNTGIAMDASAATLLSANFCHHCPFLVWKTEPAVDYSNRPCKPSKAILGRLALLLL
jgi:hypothetical protein